MSILGGKHMLRVVPFAGIPPSKKIVLKCDKCPKFFEVDRPIMKSLLQGELVIRQTPSVRMWSHCYEGSMLIGGRLAHPSTEPR